MTPNDYDALALLASVLLLSIICFIAALVLQYRSKKEAEMEQRIENEVLSTMERRYGQEQAEWERLQREQMAMNKEAWRAVQEMVSTARDLAYMEQKQK